MKTFLKVLGTTALLASVIPFSHKRDAETEQETYEALLWKAVTRPDPQGEGKRKLDITLGFNNPFAQKEDDEAHLFADELTVTYHPVQEVPQEETPVETGVPAEETVQAAPAEEAPVEETPVEETPVEEAPAQAPAPDQQV